MATGAAAGANPRAWWADAAAGDQLALTTYPRTPGARQSAVCTSPHGVARPKVLCSSKRATAGRGTRGHDQSLPREHPFVARYPHAAREQFGNVQRLLGIAGSGRRGFEIPTCRSRPTTPV